MSGRTATLLVFLATATWTGIVPADLRFLTGNCRHSFNSLRDFIPPALLLALACDQPEEPAPEPKPTPRLSEAQIEEARKVVDVEGVPPLFPEGRQHPANPISLNAYFERFGTSQLIDGETRTARPDLLESLEQELVGKQVTWDGYVDRVRPLPSGRATLVITPAPEKPGLDVAMVKFPAGDTEELLSYAKGDRVRVVWRESWGSLYHSQVRIAHLDLVLLDRAKLIGRRGDRVEVIPLDQVSLVQKRVGTRPATAPEMVIGSAAGFAAAFAAGAIKAIADPTVEGSSAVIDDGLVAGVLIGAPLGALAAYLRSRARPLYEDIGFGDAQPVVVPTRTGGVGFGISLPSR